MNLEEPKQCTQEHRSTISLDMAESPVRSHGLWTCLSHGATHVPNLVPRLGVIVRGKAELHSEIAYHKEVVHRSI